MTTQLLPVATVNDIPDFDTRFYRGYTGDPTAAVAEYTRKYGAPAVAWVAEKERLTVFEVEVRDAPQVD